MKHCLLGILSMISICVPVSAAADGSGCRNRAEAFLQGKWEQSSDVRRLPASVKSNVTLRDGMAAVNVSAGSRRGFVLYAGSSQDAPVLGYSTTDTIDLGRLPQAAEEFLQAYRKAPRRRVGQTSQGTPSWPAPTVEPVAPFITTKWGQGAPFNSRCPLYQGRPSLTGCDAVAVGQVLHYYKAGGFNDYRIEYADERSGAEVSLQYGGMEFDYSAMLDEYADGSYTREQADAVAQMMYAAGAACHMKWSDTKSSGQWPVVALDKYFNLNATFLMREKLPTGFWMRKLQENLTARRPVLYTGTGVSNSAYSAHIFVLDGIDAENYVHVNWGWGGNADGYYDITFSHPDIFGDSEDGYYMKQLMICDIEPRKAGEKYQERVVMTSSTDMIPFSGGTLSGEATGYTTNSYDDLSNLAARLVAVKGSEQYGVSFSLGQPNHYYFKQFPEWGYISWSESNWGKPDGRYEMMVETYIYDTGEHVAYSPVPMRPYMEIADGALKSYGYLDYPEGKTYAGAEKDYLSVLSFEPVTRVTARAPFFARIKTRSLLSAIGSYDVKSRHLIFTDTESGRKFVTRDRVQLYDLNYSGLDYETVIAINPPKAVDNGFAMPEGRYQLSVAEDNSNGDSSDSRVVFPTPVYLDVEPETEYPILQYDIDGTLMLSSWNQGTDYSKRWGDKANFRINRNFKGIVCSNTAYTPVTMLLYAGSVGSPDEEDIILSSFRFDPAVGFTALTTPLAHLYPLEGEYMFYLRYLTPDGVTDILPEYWEYVDKATGLPAAPTRHYITADPAAVLPMIEVSEADVSGGSLVLTARNAATRDFSGVLRAEVYDLRKGAVNVHASGQLELQPGASALVSIPLGEDVSAQADLYVHSATADSSESVLAVKSGGGVARYHLGQQSVTGITDSAASIVVDGNTIVARNIPAGNRLRVYTMDGRLVADTACGSVNGVAPGLYIVRAGAVATRIAVPAR